MTMRRMLATTIAVAALAAPSHAAPADPMVMTATGGKQDGELAYYTDSYRRGDVCGVGFGDGTGKTPSAVRHDESALTWRLPDTRRPLKVTLAAREYVVSVLPVVQSPRYVDVTLREVRSGGKVVAWQVTSAPIGRGDFRLDLEVVWKGSCGYKDVSGRVYRVLSL